MSIRHSTRCTLALPILLKRTTTPSTPLHRALFSTTRLLSSSKNRIYPTTIRNEPDLQTLILMSASSRTPLLTLWTTNFCPSCKTISPLIRSLLEQEKIGEAEGGVGYVEVEMDSPDLGGVGGVAMRYGINSIPTLLAFDRQEPQVETKVGNVRDLGRREVLVEWIRREAARQGEGGAGGKFWGLFGR